MGGGAGIGFKVYLESIRLKHNGQQWEAAEWPEIEKWEAEDYMNAMQGIRPSLLKVVSFHITESDPDIEYAKRTVEYHGGTVHSDTCTLEGSAFGGYTRGPWENMFPLEFTGTVHIQYYGDVQGTLVVKPANKRQFGAFYRMLFEGYRGMPESAKMDNGKMDDWYDRQWRKLEYKYGGA